MAAITLRGDLTRDLTPEEVDANFTALNTENAAQQTTLDAKAPLLSPNFTGAPTAPTPSVDDSSQKLATTAFLQGQASDDDPQPNAGTASPGTSTKWARADHVHIGGSGSGSVQNALTPASTTDAPSVDAVVAALADKANSSDVNQTIDNLNASLGAQIAAKENALTFIGATRDGNTVSVDPAKVGGSLLDGVSFYMLPQVGTGYTVAGAQVNNLVTVGTAVATGPNNPTNNWNNRARSGNQSAAGAGSQARLHMSVRVRHPNAAVDPTIGGFKVAMTYASADGLTACRGWIGMLQNLPAANVAIASYTGGRFGFAYETTDTNLKLYSGATLIKDLGASFPCNGNETNPYLIEFESVPQIGAAARHIRWKITHLLSGATDSGTTTDIPAGDHAPQIGFLRENGANASAVTFYTSGIAGGAFYSLVVGERLDIPTPVRITATGNLNRLQHANVDLFVKSATPVVLTVASSGFVDGDKIYGENRGTADITFAGAGGFTIERHADLPAAVEPKQGFTLSYDGVDNVWTRVA